MRRRVRFVAMTACIVAVASGTSVAAAASRPDPQLTPGAVEQQAADAPTRACTTTAPPELGAKARQKVFTAYHVKDAARSSYVIDRLVPVALGGTDARSNLWPLRRNAVARKRAIELEVAGLVCNGTLDLATAQQLMRNDWSQAAAHARNAVEQRKTSIAAYLVAVEQAERERQLNEYLASLPTPTAAPRRVPTRPQSLPTVTTNPCMAFSIPRDPNNPSASPPTCPLP